MVWRNLHATNTNSFESSLINKPPRARAGRIGKIGSARKARGLFGPSGFLHFYHGHFGKRILRLTIFQVEHGRQNEVSILSFESRESVRIFHVRIRKSGHFASMGIQNLDMFDNLAGIESKTPSIPHHSAANSARKTYPRKQCGGFEFFYAFRNKRSKGGTRLRGKHKHFSMP